MNDRDLISACRVRLAAVGPDPGSDPLFDYTVWAVETMPRLADALEAALQGIESVQTAHELQLTRLAADRSRAERKIARLKFELEVACRPPLGFLVLSRNPDSGRLQPHGRVHPTRGPAEEWKQYLETPGGPRIPIRQGAQHLVAEIREARA